MKRVYEAEEGGTTGELVAALKQKQTRAAGREGAKKK